MRRTANGVAGGLWASRVAWLVLATSVALLLGSMVLPGESDAQDTPPDFLVKEQPAPPAPTSPAS